MGTFYAKNIEIIDDMPCLFTSTAYTFDEVVEIGKLITPTRNKDLPYTFTLNGVVFTNKSEVEYEVNGEIVGLFTPEYMLVLGVYGEVHLHEINDFKSKYIKTDTVTCDGEKHSHTTFELAYYKVKDLYKTEYSLKGFSREDLDKLLIWSNQICDVYMQNNDLIEDQFNESGLNNIIELNLIREQIKMFYPVAKKIKNAIEKN